MLSSQTNLLFSVTTSIIAVGCSIILMFNVINASPRMQGRFYIVRRMTTYIMDKNITGRVSTTAWKIDDSHTHTTKDLLTEKVDVVNYIMNAFEKYH